MSILITATLGTLWTFCFTGRYIENEGKVRIVEPVID